MHVLAMFGRACDHGCVCVCVCVWLYLIFISERSVCVSALGGHSFGPIGTKFGIKYP